MQEEKKALEVAVNSCHVGLVCKIINGEFRKTFEENARKAGMDSLTITHGRILGFLARSGDKEVFQRDIEKEFNINRSTVTGLMKAMEKNGLIERKMTAYDNRLRQVLLTKKGMDMHKKSIHIIEKTEAQLVEGIKQEELDSFFNTIKTIHKNMKKGD